MTRRQSVPQQWLIVAAPAGDDMWRAVRRLPHDSGVLLLQPLGGPDKRRLLQLCRLRSLTMVIEKPGTAARVHNARELRQALSRRTPLILLSPIFRTQSHPNWKSLPRMRAATLARLAGRRAIALGGMNAERYAKVAPLGFIAWGGISVFRT